MSQTTQVDIQAMLLGISNREMRKRRVRKNRVYVERRIDQGIETESEVRNAAVRRAVHEFVHKEIGNDPSVIAMPDNYTTLERFMTSRK